MDEIRLIDANALKNKVMRIVFEIADTPMPNEYTSKLALKMGELIQKVIDEAPTVDAEVIE